MLENLSRHPGPLSSNAVVIPATPPPRITTRGSDAPASPSGTGRLPKDLPEVNEKVELEPERHEGADGTGREAKLARDRFAVELRDPDRVVVRQDAARSGVQHGVTHLDHGLVTRRALLVGVTELLEQHHRN